MCFLLLFLKWTGSVNPTDGGMYGQSNVGHIVRDEDVASKYFEYWHHLSQDLPGRKHPSASSDDDINEPMDEWNERQQPDLEGPVTTPSVTVMFSPRKTTDMIQWYADRMGEAKTSVHYTAAFGISQPFCAILSQGHSSHKPTENGGVRRSPRIAKRSNNNVTASSSGDSLLRYVLLDNKPSLTSSDKRKASAEKKGKDLPLDYYDIKDIRENRIAFGALLSPPTNDDDHDDSNAESLTGLTTFVDYIHTKYLIIDALTDNPLVATGSANFSLASTDKVRIDIYTIIHIRIVIAYLLSSAVT